MFLLRLTSVRLPTAATATTDITHTLARPTATTLPNTSMAAFLSARVPGSTASTAATGRAIVISAATMTADSVIVTGSAIFVVGVTSVAEDSAAATDSEVMVISMAVDSTAGVNSTVAAEGNPVVVASTAALRAAADIADRASGLTLRTNGWRLRQPFFSPISHLQKSASTQSAQKANQDRFLLGCCS